MTRAIAPWAPQEWTEERKALVRAQIAPPQAPPDAVSYFIAWCERTGLDPFVKQAWLVERKQKLSNGSWAVKFEPMAAESGLGAIADCQPDYLGIDGDVVYAGDSFSIKRTAGGAAVVHHEWDLETRRKNGMQVIGAWAHVLREGQVTPPVFLTVSQRIQTFWSDKDRKHVSTPFWEKDPGGQIFKCSRAMAYRLGYRNLFAGVYIREEMGSTEREDDAMANVVEGEVATDRPKSKTEALIASLPKAQPKPALASSTAPVVTFTKPATQPAAVEPKKEDPSRLTFGGSDPGAPAPAAPIVGGAAAEPPKPSKPVLRWGASKGQVIEELPTYQLEEEIATARARVDKAKGTEAWVKGVKDGIRDIEDELNRREADAAEQSADLPEDHEEGLTEGAAITTDDEGGNHGNE